LDPVANIEDQREIAKELQEILDPPGFLSTNQTDTVVHLADRLSALVLALDEWRLKDGFDPYRD
jgi:hypothetical protein